MTNAIVAAVKTEGNERGDHERRAGGKLRSENHGNAALQHKQRCANTLHC